MTDKVQKIREKVVEIVNSINPFIPDEDGKNSEYEAGRFAMVTQIMQIIDSLQEEPVSDDLEDAAKDYSNNLDNIYGSIGKQTRNAFKAGAEWQKEQFEKNRLKHCDELTAEQAQIESDFVIEHLKKNNRTPTFIDAIEYGMNYITKKVGSYTTTTKVIKKGENI